MRTGSKELIRDINSHLILEIILREGRISRAALAKKSGLTKATVSAIVLELMQKKLDRSGERRYLHGPQAHPPDF